jgi:diamine N-acetyltransferase
LALEIADHQRGLVATMAESFTDALFPPEDGWDGSETWIRGVTRNGVAAGFIMCSDPPDSKKDPWVWRLLVDRNHQGFGVGTFAVKASLERYRALGYKRVFTCWSAAPGNASGFYAKLGFRETGDFLDDEIVAVVEL